MEPQKPEPISKLGQHVISILLLPFTLAWKGYVACLLWQWLIVRTFHVTALSVPQTIGIMVIAVFTVTRRPTGKDDESLRAYIVGCITYPALYLLIGWILQLFIPS